MSSAFCACVYTTLHTPPPTSWRCSLELPSTQGTRPHRHLDFLTWHPSSVTRRHCFLTELSKAQTERQHGAKCQGSTQRCSVLPVADPRPSSSSLLNLRFLLILSLQCCFWLLLQEAKVWGWPCHHRPTDAPAVRAWAATAHPPECCCLPSTPYISSFTDSAQVF